MITEAASIIEANAAMLAFLVPLIAAAFCLVVPTPRWSWAIGIMGCMASFVLSLQVALNPDLYLADGVGGFVAPLAAGGGLLALLAAWPRSSAWEHAYSHALGLCVVAGWVGALLAQDFVGAYVAAMAAWLAGAGLIAVNGVHDRAALNGALRMLVAGGVASALYLAGVAFIARGLGVVSFGALSGVGGASALGVAGAAMMMAALSVMAAAAPFHFWAAGALGRAGVNASLTVGAVGVAGAVGLLVRFGAHAAIAPGLAGAASAMLAAIGAACVLIGSFQAMGAANVRRLAVYAATVQVGGVLIAAALGSPAGVAAALVQVFGLSAAMIALLGAASAAGDARTLEAFDGLARRAPVAAFAIMLGALSLMGAPLTIGFLGRWRLIEAGVGAGWWWAAGAMIVASLAGVFYGGRLIERLYFRRAGASLSAAPLAERILRAPTLAAGIAAIGFGLAPAWLLDLASRAAATLFGGAP